MANLCIVGLGGIGSRIASALGLTHNLVLIDPDTYEPQNSHRQPLALMYPNALKAEAISNFISSFTSLADSPTPTTQILPTPLTQLTPLPLLDLIICATDTNTGRLAARHHAHDQSIPLIIAANEQYDGEAYIYLPQWQNTPLDPWTIWPALNEPDAPNTAIHCTDPRIATQAPQTPPTNTRPPRGPSNPTP